MGQGGPGLVRNPDPEQPRDPPGVVDTGSEEPTRPDYGAKEVDMDWDTNGNVH